MEAPDLSRCGVALCKEWPVLLYTHKGIRIGACPQHWKMHCNNLVPFSLKEVCERYVGEEPNGT